MLNVPKMNSIRGKALEGKSFRQIVREKMWAGRLLRNMRPKMTSVPGY